jgi:hypothetical protein
MRERLDYYIAGDIQIVRLLDKIIKEIMVVE